LLRVNCVVAAFLGLNENSILDIIL
jgi:hypothetical protein